GDFQAQNDVSERAFLTECLESSIRSGMDRPLRRFVNFLQWHPGPFGHFLARLKFRRGLHHLAVQFPNLDRNLAVSRLHLRTLSPELAPLRQVAADAKGAGLAEH